MKEDGKSGLMDYTGKILLPPIYNSISSRNSNGIFSVVIKQIEGQHIISKTLFGLISRNNQIVLEPIYDTIQRWQDNDSLFRIVKDEKMG